MASIEFVQVTKAFDKNVVIKDLDLTIEDGKFTVLVGPSGCGKTTLLRMIAGLDPQTSGKVLIDGKDVTRIAPGQRGVAMVFQNYAIYPTMSVRENIEFGLKNNKVGKEERTRLVEMFLKGFGHGVQIGVETVGDTAYLWTETDSVAEGSDGWGTQIARFRFENEKILTPTSPELEKHRLVEGADRTTVNIDAAHGLLTMRYRKDGVFRFGVYALEEVKRHRYTPVADVPQPAMGTFQGFASYGGYLYLLEGNAYGSNGSVAPTGNTYITAVDLNTGEVVDKQLILAGDTLSFREPEGLAIRLPKINNSHKAELCIGFASNFTPARLANIYSLDRLLPVEAHRLTE